MTDRNSRKYPIPLSVAHEAILREMVQAIPFVSERVPRVFLEFLVALFNTFRTERDFGSVKFRRKSFLISQDRFYLSLRSFPNILASFLIAEVLWNQRVPFPPPHRRNCSIFRQKCFPKCRNFPKSQFHHGNIYPRKISSKRKVLEVIDPFFPLLIPRE